MSVTVKYFALLREQAGCAEENIAAPEASLQKLYQTLTEKHGFTLPAANIRAAVNERFCDMEYMLKNGDIIVFIPPVAGG